MSCHVVETLPIRYCNIPIMETAVDDVAMHKRQERSIFWERTRFFTMKYIRMKQRYTNIFGIEESMSMEITPPENRNRAKTAIAISRAPNLKMRFLLMHLIIKESSVMHAIPTSAMVGRNGSKNIIEVTPASGEWRIIMHIMAMPMAAAIFEGANQYDIPPNRMPSIAEPANPRPVRCSYSYAGILRIRRMSKSMNEIRRLSFITRMRGFFEKTIKIAMLIKLSDAVRGFMIIIS
jgi:hypothetical protein